MNNSIKKQSIPQACQWGMEFLSTPINKMPVKIATGEINAYQGDWHYVSPGKLSWESIKFRKLLILCSDHFLLLAKYYI